MKKFLPLYKLLVILLIGMTLAGCAAPKGDQTLSDQESVLQNSDSETVNSTNLNESTHGKDAEPNYSIVFPQDSVNLIDITLPVESWTAMQAEMTDQFGAQGTGQGSGNPGQRPGGQNFDNQQPPQGNPQGPGNFQPGGRPGNGMGGMDIGDTSYVKGTVTFNGETWEGVGFRYSGNSTLQSSWKNGTQKISFRLDFDEFEDEDPAITN